MAIRFFYYLCAVRRWQIQAYILHMSKNLFSLNIRGRLLSFSEPVVMGIINATPDSFYSGSRTPDAPDIEKRALSMLEQGATMLDVGGYSTRPGAPEVSADEEFSRLARALETIRKAAPEAIVSIDTFRADVARKCVEQFGADIINDVAGGTLDPGMAETVAELHVPYVLMHMRGTPATMQTLTDYDDVTADIIRDLAFKADALRSLGVADIIIDPGFGFAKTVAQNFRLLRELGEFRRMGMPVLAGLSRKSMIWRALGTSPADALNGTSVLNTIALLNGADILRVHDVAEAVEAVKLCNLTINS